MQNLLSKDLEAVSANSSFWSRLGPVLLMGSFAIVLLKCASLYWPLALTALMGYATTLYWKKRGFYLSLIILAAVSVLLMQTGVRPIWSSLLSISIALSWLLIFLGDQEMESQHLGQEKKIQSLKENCSALEKQLREAKVAISSESKDLIAEKERLALQLNDVTAKCNQSYYSLQLADKEREKLADQCEALSQDIFVHQRKEIAFQHALDDAQTQLIKLKNQLAVEQPKVLKDTSSSLVSMEEIDPLEKDRLELIQHQYANLREQFDEKSDALDQARKELFKVENELLALRKVSEENAHESFEENFGLIKDLKLMDEECRELEAQIVSLQEFITALLSPKKRTAKKSSNKLEDQGLPFLLHEKILSTERLF